MKQFNFGMKFDSMNPFAAFAMHRIASRVACTTCHVGPGEQCVNIFAHELRRPRPHDSRLHAGAAVAHSDGPCSGEKP